jgi:hypothetical protein
MWTYHLTGSPDSKAYQHQWINPDTIKWVHLPSDLNAEPWVSQGWWFVEVGTDDYVEPYMNDVSCDATMNNQWFIDQILIDAVPFP